MVGSRGVAPGILMERAQVRLWSITHVLPSIRKERTGEHEHFIRVYMRKPQE